MHPIWVHVSSSGEFEQCLPVLDELKLSRPAQKVFLSYFSSSAYKAIGLEKRRRLENGTDAPWDYADYSPLDSRYHVRHTFEILQPKALVCIHREIWPELIAEANRRSVPCLLFAASFPPAARKWFGFYRELLKKFQVVATTDAASADFLGSELMSPIEALGDPRLERVLARRKTSDGAIGGFAQTTQKTLICASLWPVDFENLKPALRYLYRVYPEWRIILVPHEPSASFLRGLQSWASEIGASPKLWSQWSVNRDESRVVLVDQVGFLAELYRMADLVFVGGSFRKRVHNVLEPAAYGKPIVTGPFIQNSAEAIEMAEERFGLYPTASPEELAGALERLVSDESFREQSALRAASYFEGRLGASKRYADEILKRV